MEHTRSALKVLLSAALCSESPIFQAVSAVKAFRARGASAEDLLVVLEELRPTLSEEQEDAALEVMDVVSGWCSPDRQL